MTSSEMMWPKQLLGMLYSLQWKKIIIDWLVEVD
jgi:hypothetical protein